MLATGVAITRSAPGTDFCAATGRADKISRKRMEVSAARPAARKPDWYRMAIECVARVWCIRIVRRSPRDGCESDSQLQHTHDPIY